MYVVAIGDAFSGIYLVGPFAAYQDAFDYAETVQDADWNIVDVNSPDAEEE